MTGRTLILFDIDHTLLDVAALHEAAYESVVERTHGRPVRLRDMVYAGKTTPNILRDLCTHVGVEPATIEARLTEMTEAFSAAVVAGLAGDLRPYVLGGVPELLDCLEARGHLLGIVTGNPPEIGREVLGRAGLLPHFRVFAFGPERPERWQLVALAIERAAAEAGQPIPPERVVVVGDTPFDVEAGKACGAATVLVGTGVYSREELEAAAADLFVFDFGDFATACEALTALAAAR